MTTAAQAVADLLPSARRSRPWTAAHGLLFAATCLASGALLWFFHDRYWYPTDDGFYAHIAERLLAGEVLNRDVQDIRPGFIHFVHAAAFSVLGIDLLSLRYPLIAAAFVQSILIFLLLRRRDPLLAAIAALASNAVGIVQFMSPTANWYCLALAAALALWLTAVPPGHRGRLIGAGALLGALVLFRHLTGVWAAMGVISFALLERSSDARGRETVLARAQVLIMALAVIGYLAASPHTSFGGLLLMGIWPIAVLAWFLVRLRTRNRDVLSAVGQLFAGVMIPAAPLLAYHIVNGSLPTLAWDLVVAAAGELRLPFYDGRSWFNYLSIAGLHQAISSPDLPRFLNGLYWAFLPLASAINGFLVLRHLQAGSETRQLALPLLAVFYALVSLNFEGPLYLYYAVPLTVTSLLWLAASCATWIRVASATAASLLCLVAVSFHAGQGRERTALQILQGARITEFSSLVPCGLERCSLQVSAADASRYQQFVTVIREQTAEHEAILALPNDAELYFLSRRRSPVRFYNAALGMVSAADADEVSRTLEADPPRLVVFRPGDKYNAPETARLMGAVKERYGYLGAFDGAEIYRR